ncbi:MAG: RNA methyltransferase [Syntrophaceticus sp.]
MEIKTAKQAIRFARDLKKRKHRQNTNRFLIEGVNFVEDAFINGAELDYLLVSESFWQREKGKVIIDLARSQGIPFFSVQENTLARLADTETPQGILAVSQMPVWNEDQVLQGQDTILVALDGLQDPGNLGTIIRSGAGVGVSGFYLGEGTVDLYNPKVLRSTMGTIFRVPAFQQVQLFSFIKRLKSLGFKTIAADPRAKLKYYRADFLKGPLLILIGNEGKGISLELLDIVDLRVSIPLSEGVESLNAAVAAALILYEVVRQRDLEG